jgi:hypothetical protein
MRDRERTQDRGPSNGQGGAGPKGKSPPRRDRTERRNASRTEVIEEEHQQAVGPRDNLHTT